MGGRFNWNEWFLTGCMPPVPSDGVLASSGDYPYKHVQHVPRTCLLILKTFDFKHVHLCEVIVCEVKQHNAPVFKWHGSQGQSQGHFCVLRAFTCEDLQISPTSFNFIIIIIIIIIIIMQSLCEDNSTGSFTICSLSNKKQTVKCMFKNIFKVGVL